MKMVRVKIYIFIQHSKNNDKMWLKYLFTWTMNISLGNPILITSTSDGTIIE